MVPKMEDETNGLNTWSSFGKWALKMGDCKNCGGFSKWIREIEDSKTEDLRIGFL